MFQIQSNVDIVIAGGGPAGLCAAETAAQAGCSVAVFEQNHEIGSPTRTSGGTFVKDMQELGVPSEFYHVLSRCRFVSPSNSASFDYDEPNLCGINVRRVFQFLAERAISAGASVRTATQVVDVLSDVGQAIPPVNSDVRHAPSSANSTGISGIRTKSRNGEQNINARVTIDATGYRATLVKKTKAHDGFNRFGVGAEYDLFAPNYDEREAVLIVGDQIAPSGYAWFLPYGGHRVRAGVGVIHKDSTADPNEYLDMLMANAHTFAVDLRRAQPVEYHYGLIPSDGVAECYTADGLLAVGDAAGHASCLVGEGIRWAMRAGNMAGAIAAEAVRKGDTSKQMLSRYEQEWSKAFGFQLRVAAEINRRIARWHDEQWNRGTELLKALTPEQFDQAIRSDFSPSWMASVLFSNPRLLKTGFRELATKVSSFTR